MRFLLCLAAFLAPVSAANALDEFSTYRIGGGELAGVELTQGEYEDPAQLKITFPEDMQREPLVIESDWPLEDCMQNVTRVRDNPSAEIEIVVHETAQTMNGVMVIQCAIIH